MTTQTDDPALNEMLRLAQQQTEEIKSLNQTPPSSPPDEGESSVTNLGSSHSAPDQLTPEELQKLREMLVQASFRGRGFYELPEKPVTDEDRTRFFESVGERKPYAEEMILIPEKLEVIFRCKTRREVEMVDAQLQKDMEEGLIKNEKHHAIATTNYNLMVQMSSLNGVACSSPSKFLSVPNFSLRKHIESHVINTMPEPVMFILSGALTQFERRVEIMSKECLQKNFTKPAVL